MTRNIFNKPPLKAFRHAKNLKDLLVSLPQNLPALVTGPFATRPYVNSSTITTPKRHVNIKGHFSCITEHVVYCLSCTKCPLTVYIGETGCRSVDRFREHCRDVMNGRNDLPVPAHFNSINDTLEDMKVAVLKAGLANQDYWRKQEMRLIFKYGTMGPSGLNQDFSFTWITLFSVLELLTVLSLGPWRRQHCRNVGSSRLSIQRQYYNFQFYKDRSIDRLRRNTVVSSWFR